MLPYSFILTSSSPSPCPLPAMYLLRAIVLPFTFCLADKPNSFSLLLQNRLSIPLIVLKGLLCTSSSWNPSSLGTRIQNCSQRGSATCGLQAGFGLWNHCIWPTHAGLWWCLVVEASPMLQQGKAAAARAFLWCLPFYPSLSSTGSF